MRPTAFEEVDWDAEWAGIDPFASACDCGGAKTAGTHSDWCSSQQTGPIRGIYNIYVCQACNGARFDDTEDLTDKTCPCGGVLKLA